MTGWIVTIIVGFIAGALGKFVMPGKDPGGCLITTLLGIAGAIVGKFLATHFGFDAGDAGSAFDFRSLGVSIAGVVVLLLIYRLITGKRTEG